MDIFIIMDLERIIDVLGISLPVFAMVGLGKILSVRGFITEDRKAFMNEFVNTFCLPALIFINVATQDFSVMWNPALVLPSMLAVLILAFIFVIMVKIFGYKGGFAAAWVFGIFWGNISYVGFPMSDLAFGNIGVNYAAVFNAYFQVIYIPLAFILIGVYGAYADNASVLQIILKIIKSPLVLSAIFGTLVAYTGDFFRVDHVLENGEIIRELNLPVAVMGGLAIIEAFLRLIGSMGLPMALVAIGAALNLKALTDKFFALLMVILGKLILLPALALVIATYLFPDVSKEVLGIGVLLSAMPDAVAAYVVGKQAGVDEGFLSSMLVLSTAVSIVTIPLWLYIII